MSFWQIWLATIPTIFQVQDFQVSSMTMKASGPTKTRKIVLSKLIYIQPLEMTCFQVLASSVRSLEWKKLDLPESKGTFRRYCLAFTFRCEIWWKNPEHIKAAFATSISWFTDGTPLWIGALLQEFWELRGVVNISARDQVPISHNRFQGQGKLQAVAMVM